MDRRLATASAEGQKNMCSSRFAESWPPRNHATSQAQHSASVEKAFTCLYFEQLRPERSRWAGFPHVMKAR
eukprot:3202596-Alexandrium_andersonii.AAC.1